MKGYVCLFQIKQMVYLSGHLIQLVTRKGLWNLQKCFQQAKLADKPGFASVILSKRCYARPHREKWASRGAHVSKVAVVSVERERWRDSTLISSCVASANTTQMPVSVSMASTRPV